MPLTARKAQQFFDNTLANIIIVYNFDFYYIL